MPPSDVTSNNCIISFLGVALNTDIDTEFEILAEVPISGGSFFDSISDGDLVMFRDEQVSDGVADKVEFED